MRSGALVQLLRTTPTDPRPAIARGELNFTFFYIGPESYLAARRDVALYAGADYIASDGILFAACLKLLGRKRRTHLTFDYTSLAPSVFDAIAQRRGAVALVGGTTEEARRAAEYMEGRHEGLRCVLAESGFFDWETERSALLARIIAAKPAAVVLGNGFPRQNRLALALRAEGFEGSIFTCGAFIHQTARRGQYFPTWINRLHLRAFYRIVKEPYVLRRVLIAYPRGVFWFLVDFAAGR
ncbi:MAG: WecB/TagA/CpsF family glycosyltransferase [Gemmatimonadaceae bacterium]|nr:WecB/TagA/CpsF family glycosyltransferase [Gemmatimonadaceae bacterium]